MITSNLTHHMVLFGTLDQVPSCPFTCFDMPGMVTMLYGWALGQGPLDFPPNVGLRIGSGSSYTLSTLQMHYSNPLAAAGIDDSSGLEWLLEWEQLRPFVPSGGGRGRVRGAAQGLRDRCGAQEAEAERRRDRHGRR